MFSFKKRNVVFFPCCNVMTQFFKRIYCYVPILLLLILSIRKIYNLSLSLVIKYSYFSMVTGKITVEWMEDMLNIYNIKIAKN